MDISTPPGPHTEQTTQKQPGRTSFAFVLVALGLDALGVGIIAPIVPRLVQDLSHLRPEQAAPWVGALVAAYAGVQFLMAPVLGALSDRYGRRPVILVSVAGIAADYLLLAWAPSLWWLFLGRLIAGATSANVAAATAYIADVSSAEERVGRFGLIGAVFGAGFVIGPAMGGVLGEIGLRIPFYVAAGVAGANALYGLFVLPESLAPQDRRPFEWSRANAFTALRSVWRTPPLRRMAIAWSCSWVGLGAIQSTLVLFVSYRFGWGAWLAGLLLAALGLSQAVVEGALLTRVTDRLGERRTALLGYAALATGYAALSLAFAGWALFPAVALLTIGGLALPSIRAMAANRQGSDNQGQMQGVLTAVEGLTALVAPLLTAGLFYAFTSPGWPVHFSGAPFLFAAMTAALAGVLLRRL